MIASRSLGLQDANGRFGNDIAFDRIVVAAEKDIRPAAVEDAIFFHAVVVSFDTDVLEDGGTVGGVASDHRVISNHKNSHLADPYGVIQNAHAIRLHHQNIGGDGLASGGIGARGPDIVGYDIFANGSGGCKSDLHTILRGAFSWARSGDDIVVNAHLSTSFVGGDAILLKIVNGALGDLDLRAGASSALDEHAGTALAGGQAWA